MAHHVPDLMTFKMLGVAGIASYAVARLAVHSRFMSWHRAHVVAVPRSKLPAMPRGFAIREIGVDELARWPIDVTPAQATARFSQAISCLGCFKADGDLTGVVWMTDTGCTEGDLALYSRPPADGAWDTGMWIHPDHRLGRTFQALWAGVGAWLDARGLTASYSAIADYNLGSLGAHRRLGMQRVGMITALRIGRWQWIAAGPHGWRSVRPGSRIEWQVPKLPASSPVQQHSPSLAA